MARTQTERAVIDLVINGQQAKTNLKEITLEMTRQRSALLKLNEADNPAEYKARLDNYHKLLAAQREMKQRIDDTSTAWGRFKKEMGAVTMGVVGGNVITFALQQLAALIPGTIDHTMKLKDAFADMAKATGLSEEGVKKLNKELKSIDTRTTNSDLRAIAVAGGQLGVANKEMVEFVTNVDKAVVALGDEFTGGVDQVAKELGGIGKLFDETKDMSAGKVINDVGSALNELGAAGSATSPVIAEFTTRMGQLGGLAPKLTETLGLGAALQELGLTAEIASSGLSGLMLTAANKSDLFAQHLGMSKKAVEELINTSPNQFLMTLAKSFEGLAPAQVAQRLKELKVESQESIKVMSLLAGQTDFVAQKQKLAADAMAKGTSLSDEAAKKNHQLAKDLKELNEWFNSLLTSEGLQTFLVSAIHSAVDFTKELGNVGKWLGKNSEWFGIAVAATTAYYLAVTRSTVSVIANTVAETYRKVAYEVGFRWLLLSTGAQSAYATVMAASTLQARLAAVAQLALTGAVSAARGVWAGFTAILAANPIGAVVVALTALVASIKYFSENTERALAIERKLTQLRSQNKIATDQSAQAMKDLNGKMSHYNDLSAAEQANLKKTIALKQVEAKSRLENVYAKSREIARQSADLNLWQRMKVSASSTFQSDADLKRNHDLAVEENKAQAYDRAKLEGGSEQRKAEWDQYKEMMAEIDRMDSRKPGKTGGGKLNAITDPDKKDKASEKAKNEAKHDAEELEKMLADARQDALKSEQSDYDKAVFAFAEKYTKMYDLAKGNTDKIKEIERLSLLEMAAIQKSFDEKQEAEALKTSMKELKNIRETELAKIKARVAAGGITKEEGDVAAGLVEQQYLLAKELIYANHYQTLRDLAGDNAQKLAEIDQTAATEQETLETDLTQNVADQATQRTELKNAELEHAKTVLDKKKDFAREEKEYQQQMLQGLAGILQNDWTSTLANYKDHWHQMTLVQKGALIAGKAYALAEIGINLARQITLVNTAAAMADSLTFGVGGTAIRIIGYAKAIGSAAIQTAAVVAAGSQTAAFADGGYTGSGDGPAGFVDNPTLFKMGKRQYVAGEAGREFVISNKALQNPAVANFAGMMDVMQRSNNYSMLSTGAASPAPGATGNGGGSVGSGANNGDAAMMAMLAEMRAMRQDMKEQASKPLDFNYRLFEQYRDQVDDLRSTTKL